MSRIVFSDSTNKTGLVELLARATGTQDATTSSYPIKQKTVDINDAVDEYFALARAAAPQIKLHDTNFTGEPIYTQNLTSGTQLYTYTDNADSAQIEAVDRVDIEMPNGTTKRLKKYNPQDIGLAADDTQGLIAYENVSGTPERYRLVGKNIVISPKPNYTTSSGTGLRLYHESAPSYFVSTDTTKYAGINNTFHKYLWVRPAYQWLLIKKGAAAASGMRDEMLRIETRITAYFKSLFDRDNTSRDSKRMKGRSISANMK